MRTMFIVVLFLTVTLGSAAFADDVMAPPFRAGFPPSLEAPDHQEQLLRFRAPIRIMGHQRADAAYEATPQNVVEEMLKHARVRGNDTVYDLGCGDGRVLVTAAKVYGCRGVGYETDPDLAQLARENARLNGVDTLVMVREKDLLDADLTRASVIFLYLYPEISRKLLPKFRRLSPGTWILSHGFEVPGLRKAAPRYVTSGVRRHVFYGWYVPCDPVPAVRVEVPGAAAPAGPAHSGMHSQPVYSGMYNYSGMHGYSGMRRYSGMGFW